MAKFSDLHGQPVEDTSTDPIIYEGKELTDERAAEIAAETLAKVRRSNLVPGGKSMSGGGKHSPVVQFRVAESVRSLLDSQAAAAGMTPSRLARKALEEYLEAHG